MIINFHQFTASSINYFGATVFITVSLQNIYPLVEELDNLEVELQEHEFVSSLFNLFKVAFLVFSDSDST